MKTKEEKRAYNQRYYEANRKKLLKYQSDWYQNNKEWYKPRQNDRAAKRRREDPEYKEKEREHNRQSYRRNIAWYQVRNSKQAKTLQQRARLKLQRAVKSGKINKPDSCDSCRKKCIPDGHHHRGYKKPLAVIWLCRMCHGEVHRVI